VQERPLVLAVIGSAVAIPVLGLSYLLLPSLGIRAVGIAACATHGALALVLLCTLLRPLVFSFAPGRAALSG
jgi:hypothetical protein